MEMEMITTNCIQASYSIYTFSNKCVHEYRTSGSQKLLLHFWFAESLTNLSSQILSCSTVHFRFSVIEGKTLMDINHIFLQKPKLPIFWKFLNFLETLKIRIVLILNILILISNIFVLISGSKLGMKITQPWWQPKVQIWFQHFEGEK